MASLSPLAHPAHALANFQHSEAKFAGLKTESLAGKSGISNSDKITELSKRFETMMLKEMLKTAYKPSFGEGLFPSGGPNEIYKDMALDAIATTAARANQLGVADQLVDQLSQRVAQPPETGATEASTPQP